MNINGVEYITGVFRGDGGEKMVTHLYKGDMANPGFPMCTRGWQRRWYKKNGEIEDYEYSIFRNNWSEPGLCQICQRRAIQGSPPIEKPPNRRKTKKYKSKFSLPFF